MINYTLNIKSLMTKKQITQAEMAELLGLSLVSFNQKLNNKKHKQFYVTEAIEIAKILNATLDEIFLSQEVA